MIIAMKMWEDIMIIHTVQRGDTLSSIARRYMTTASRLASDNGLDAPNALAVGQTVVVQRPELTYTVGRGDTLDSIAERFGTSVMELYRNNPRLGGRNEIYPGEELIVSLDTKKQGSISVNGYAYPSADRMQLRGILPYLT